MRARPRIGCALVARIAALVALVAAVLHYVLTPARMAGDFGSTFDPALESLLLRSNSGTAHIVRVVGLAILLLSLDRASKLNTWAACGGAALALLSFVLMGHTVIHEQRWILAPLLLVHVVVAAVWLGALAGLYLAARADGHGERSARRALLGARDFGRARDLRLRVPHERAVHSQLRRARDAVRRDGARQVARLRGADGARSAEQVAVRAAPARRRRQRRAGAAAHDRRRSGR